MLCDYKVKPSYILNGGDAPSVSETAYIFLFYNLNINFIMPIQFDLKSILEKIKDIFMFREGGNTDNYLTPPTVTSGSILWGILFRSAVLIIIAIVLILLLNKREFAWIALFVFWICVAYPAYRQYTVLNKRLEVLEEETLCGKCRYFIKESQLCSALDEHISKNNIPCDGNMWEANPSLFN